MFASSVTHTNRRGIYFLTALTLLFTPLLSIASGNVRAAPAYTEVGGPIISDTTWTLANSPYIVVASVEVWQGVTLTIQPGVVVKFNKDRLLQVDGTLIARGDVANRITFTSNQSSPTKGDWKSIEFTDSSVDATFDGAGNYTGGGILQYCIVEYGGSGVESAVHAPNAAPYIDHNIVRNNAARGIRATGTVTIPVVITGNTVSGNGGGISASHSTVTGNTVSGNSTSGYSNANDGGGIYAHYSMVTGNTVSGNSAALGGGIYAWDSTVTSNTVSGNSAGAGGGIFAEGSTVTGNTVSGNSAYAGGSGGIFARDSPVTGNTVSGNSADYGPGGGIYAWDSPVTGNTVSGNSAGNGGGGISARYSSTVMGNTVSGNSVSGAYGGGGIDAANSTVTGNTVSGNSAYYGGGISASSSTVMSNTVTANRVSAATGRGSGVFFIGSGVFLYNTIVRNTVVSPTATIGGVTIYGTPQFHQNNIYGNSNYDVVVLSSQDISGTHNYWGTVATVDILAHVYDGDDDSARGRLLYLPYVQDPVPNAPVPPPQNLRATFAGGLANLSWDAIPSTTTGYGYKVYYDTDASGPPYQGSGATQGNSPVDVGNTTQFTLSGLGSGIVIAVTAYDTQGRESWYSNEVNRPWRTYLPAVLKR